MWDRCSEWLSILPKVTQPVESMADLLAFCLLVSCCTPGRLRKPEEWGWSCTGASGLKGSFSLLLGDRSSSGGQMGAPSQGALSGSCHLQVPLGSQPRLRRRESSQTPRAGGQCAPSVCPAPGAVEPPLPSSSLGSSGRRKGALRTVGFLPTPELVSYHPVSLPVPTATPSFSSIHRNSVITATALLHSVPTIGMSQTLVCISSPSSHRHPVK